MAGSSSPGDIFTSSLSPKVKGTEKKKRKRPSKKVPTTVLEASSTNFMDLVQKLTGSAAELAAAKSSPKLAKPVTTNPTSSTTSSPYSSPSGDYIDSRPSASSESYYQQLLGSATMAYGDGDDDSSSHSNYTPSAPFPNPNAHYLPHDALPTSLDHYHQSANSGYYNTSIADGDDLYNPSARVLDNEISPFSSPLASHSDYWYQQMDALHA